MNKKVIELNELNLTQLQEKVEHLRRELFGLRLNATTSHVKDYSQFEKLKRSIARVLTCIREKNAN